MLWSSYFLSIEQLTYEDCHSLVSTFDNATDALLSLKIPIKDGIRKCLNDRVKFHKLSFNSKKRFKYTIEDVTTAVPICDCFSAVCRKLEVTICTSNIQRIQQICLDNNISTIHFSHRNTMQHKIDKQQRITRTVENSLVEHSTLSRSTLRGFLIRNNLFTNQCSCCGITEWQGKPITIEVDHINGVSDDNRIENLRSLCPNCHSQTDTFKTGNIDKLTPRADFKKKHNPSIAAMHNCVHCGKEFIKHNPKMKYCSVKCGHADKNTNNWDEIDLIDLIDHQNINYSELGRRFGGISGAAVRRQYLKRKEKQL